MARAMTADEKNRFREYFPALDVDRAVVTGEATPVYNCIAWTVGVTSRWIWPGPHILNFDQFYALNGYERSHNGPISAWGHSTEAMTHGSVSGLGHGPRWESKCGQELRIQHGFEELVGANYGRVLTFYNTRRVVAPDTEIFRRREYASGVKGARKVRLRKEQADALRAVVKEVDKGRRDEFQKRFAAWSKTWSAPHTAHLSDPSFVRYNEEFAALVAMGSEIIPLVVEKLTDPKNFFALQLYDALQPKGTSTIQIDPEDDAVLEGEQGRAARTVERWISNL